MEKFIHAEWITTAEFNRCSGEILKTILKQEKLAANKNLTDVEQQAIETFFKKRQKFLLVKVTLAMMDHKICRYFNHTAANK